MPCLLDHVLTKPLSVQPGVWHLRLLRLLGVPDDSVRPGLLA